MKWHVHVRLDEETYAGMKAYFLNIATHRRSDTLAEEFSDLWCQSYGAIRAQLRNILRVVNEARKMAGYDTLPVSVIRFNRRIVKAFEEACALESYERGAQEGALIGGQFSLDKALPIH
jgi:hypothetical protein